MADDFTLANDLARAAQAAAILENPLFVDAFDALETAYIAAWRNSEARDTDGRERIFLALQVLGKVQRHLKAALNNGKVASAEIDSLMGLKA